jgi:hypothetical protein
MSQKKDISTALSLNIGESIKEAIQNVSGGGAYQLKLLLFFLTASFFINLQHQSSSLYYMNPVFECEGIQGKASEE